MNQCTETVESAKECSSKSDLVKAAATACIVNYKTLDLTRLCLRCVSKFARHPHEVIVVDNDSRDESLEYLRSLNWIRLIERRTEGGNPDGGHAHSAGLDLGLANPDKFRLSDDVTRKWNHRAKQVMSCEIIQSILKDDSLDR